jgi:protein TonB
MKKLLTLLVLLSIVAVAKAQKDTSASQPKSDTTLFMSVEISPQFPGGQEAMNRFIGKNLKYPSGETREGRVFVEFVVELDGSLTRIHAAHGPSRVLDAEAVRVVASFPKWVPGIQNGHKARVFSQAVITFVKPD